MRLLQAIAYAKRLDGAGSAKRGAIVRQVGGERQVVAFDLTAIRSGQDPDPEILLDDVIVVEDSKAKKQLRDNGGGIPSIGRVRSWALNKLENR